jgi:trigger factor
MNKGETKDLHLTFPTEYHAKDLAGKEAVFTVTVNNIEVKELPELNDDFAKEVSKFDNLADYKSDVKAKLIEQNDKRAESENENALISKVVDNAQVDIPDVMIEKQIDYIVSDTENKLKYMYGGLKFEDYLKYTGLTLDQFRANNKQRAIRDVKARLVFEELIKAESLELTDEDVDKEIQTLADSAKKSLEEYKKTMDPNHLDYIRNEALMNKLVAFLKDNNTFVAKAGAKPAAKKSSTKKTTEDKDSAANKPAAKKVYREEISGKKRK